MTDGIWNIAPVLAGIIYVVTPGPATLAVLGLSASHGRVAAARFFLGHLAGDVLWAVLALAAILGASKLGPHLFALLGLACGAYLAYLGARALFAKGSGQAMLAGSARPLSTGLVFGLTNPKAYPFSLAMFTALAVGTGTDLGFAAAADLLIRVTIGFLIGDAITIAWAGLPPIRAAFHRFGPVLTRVMGALFILFGAKTIGDAVVALRQR